MDCPNFITSIQRHTHLTLNSSGETIFVKEDDPIYVWMVEKFNGKDIGVKVFWDAGLPGGELEAGHYTSMMGLPARILIKNPSSDDGTPSTRFQKLWLCAVFEMYNLENQADFLKLSTLAAKGLVDAENFCQECARLEHRALRKTQAFYSTIWKDWAAANKVVSHSRVWRRGWRPDFGEWIKALAEAKTGYPDSSFRPLYDWAKSSYASFLEQVSLSAEKEKQK